jgi:hypothetical protein
MEQFHVISILGADARILKNDSDLAQATHELNSKCLRLHARHAVSWLLRAAFVLSLFLLGRYVVEGTIGGAISWTAGFVALHVLWHMAKGHLAIQGDRQAKLYWLQNDAGNTEFCSNDPIVATMASQEPAEAPRWFGHTAS